MCFEMLTIDTRGSDCVATVIIRHLLGNVTRVIGGGAGGGGGGVPFNAIL